MKKLKLFIAGLLITCLVSAQEVVIRGKVVSISKKQMIGTNDSTLLVTYPLRTIFLLRDDRFLIKNISQARGYSLFDKAVTQVSGDSVISYMASAGREMYLLVASEISGCRDHIVVAIFPFTGSPYFVEYLLKISPEKIKKKRVK